MDFDQFNPWTYNGASHPHPAFDYLTGFSPRKLKDMFKWAEYLYFNSPHIYAVVKKYGEFPITSLQYESDNPNEKEQHKKLHEEHLCTKGFLTEASCDKHVYGNVIISVYAPFIRLLVCPKCNTRESAEKADYTYYHDQVKFMFRCRNCELYQKAEVKDEPLRDPSKIRLIRWDVKNIDIDYNPVTKQSRYYYTIPSDIVYQVKSGNKHMISTMPMEFLEAMRNDKYQFEFDPEQVYHMKMPSISGIQGQWGLPPLISAFKMFLFAAVLRKANEAIALEHITPFRVFHPLQNAANADPFQGLNLAKWKDELERNYKLFRRDPLRIQISPVPLGVQNVGGEGRALLTLGELQEAEKNIVLAMGVPMEFLTGGLGQTRGEVTLRMIENQLQTHVEDLNRLVQWIDNRCSKILGWEEIPVRMKDFKILDDEANKQMIFQLYSAGKVSDTYVADMLNIDLDSERKQRIHDAIADAKAQMDLQNEQNAVQNSLAARSKQQAMAAQTGGTQYNQQAVLAQAEPIAQEFMSLDPGTRRSRMDALKSQDIVMASVVRELIEQQEQNAAQDAKSQSRSG